MFSPSPSPSPSPQPPSPPPLLTPAQPTPTPRASWHPPTVGPPPTFHHIHPATSTPGLSANRDPMLVGSQDTAVPPTATPPATPTHFPPPARRPRATDHVYDQTGSLSEDERAVLSLGLGFAPTTHCPTHPALSWSDYRQRFRKHYTALLRPPPPTPEHAQPNPIHFGIPNIPSDH